MPKRRRNPRRRFWARSSTTTCRPWPIRLRRSETAPAAPISDLRQAIGINDKFLMIRDLFGGDGALFDSTIEALNAQETLDDCMIYIAEHFAWNSESDSAALIMELLERKFA